MKTLRTKMVGLPVAALILSSASRTDKPVITIFMVGDSIMVNKKIDGGNLERGWGMVLPGFFSEDTRIDNHAANDRSSKNFISKGHQEEIISKVKKGDYVFVQFGHNDEKADSTRHADPGSTFDEILHRYVNETRAKSGIPVLFSSVVRRSFIQPKDDAIARDVRRTSEEKGQPKEGTVLLDTYGAYLDTPRNVAKELGATFIDMSKIIHDLVQGLGPVESKKLFIFVEPDQVPAFPEGRRDNTHLNVYGARTIAGSAVDVIDKEIPELAKYIRQFDYVVTQDGSSDFFTVQEAINAVPDFRRDVRTTILIRKGAYKKKLIIPESKINTSLIGEDGVILTYDGFANEKNVSGENMGTSGSSSCYVYAPDFYAENVTFGNSSGPVGQAVACSVSADRAYFKNCCFLGLQDALCTYNKQGRQYCENCHIEGMVGFIFGWSTTVFNRCHIHSKRDGYVTAPSTDKGKKYSYVFYDCGLITGLEAIEVYLSRPWRPYAQAVFICCELGKHILPAGWNNWGKKENEKTVFYAEYESRGEGANPRARAAFLQQLRNLREYEITTVLAGENGWNPIASGNKLITVKR